MYQPKVRRSSNRKGTKGDQPVFTSHTDQGYGVRFRADRADPTTGELVSNAVEDQTWQVLTNLTNVLSGGSGMKLLSTTVFLKDINDLQNECRMGNFLIIRPS
jgi:hypothetical protein